MEVCDRKRIQKEKMKPQSKSIRVKCEKEELSGQQKPHDKLGTTRGLKFQQNLLKTGFLLQQQAKTQHHLERERERLILHVLCFHFRATWSTHNIISVILHRRIRRKLNTAILFALALHSVQMYSMETLQLYHNPVIYLVKIYPVTRPYNFAESHYASTLPLSNIFRENFN